MSVLFPWRNFTGFGPDRLHAGLAASESFQVQHARPAGLRALVRQVCPARPGVYGMLDATGALIYVGKAKRLRQRLLGYFRPRSRDPKAGRILGHTRRILWESATSEFAALLRELELIQRWRPHFNVHGQPNRRRRAFVCLGRPAAPYVFLARRPVGVSARFGPVPAGRRAREAARWLNDYFQLRDCPQKQEMIFSDQSELFPIARAAGCLRFEIGTCLGPCIGACSSSRYRERARAALAFLKGTDAELLPALERNMEAAAARLQFERAAELRNKLEAFRWLRDTLDRVKSTRRRHSFVYRVRGRTSPDLWYLIREGVVHAVVPAPGDEPSRRAAAGAIESTFAARPSGRLRSAGEESESLFLVTAWFLRWPRERARTMPPARALQVLRSR